MLRLASGQNSCRRCQRISNDGCSVHPEGSPMWLPFLLGVVVAVPASKMDAAAHSFLPSSEDPMRIRFSMLLSICSAALSPLASAGVGMTNIVQLQAPMLFHSDGRAYTVNDINLLDLTHQASVAYDDGSADLRTPTGQLALCSRHDCAEQSLGFMPGAATCTWKFPTEAPLTVLSAVPGDR